MTRHGTPKLTTATKAAIIRLKLAEPEISAAVIAQRFGVYHGLVLNLLRSADLFPPKKPRGPRPEGWRSMGRR